MIKFFYWAAFFLFVLTANGCTSRSATMVDVTTVDPAKKVAIKQIKQPVLMALPHDASIKLRAPSGNLTVDKNLRVSLVNRYMKEAERWYQVGANVNATNANGQTLLSEMILRRDINAITFLLLRKASVNQPSQDQATPLHFAVTSNQSLVVAMLLERNAQITPFANSETLIHKAVLNNNVRLMTMLLEKSVVGINEVDESNQTLLHLAASKGNSEMAQTLLAHGADIHATYNNGVTPLHLAAARGQRAVVNVLLSHHADIKAETKKKGTPLHHAARFGHTDIVDDLLASGAPTNVFNSEGKTPLLLAKLLNHQATVNVLASQTRVAVKSGGFLW